MTNKELLPKIHLVMDKLMNLGGGNYENDRSVGKEDASRGIIA